MLYVQPMSLQLNRPVTGPDDQVARRGEALKELEQYFLFMLLREMRQSSSGKGIFERNAAMDSYEELFDDAIARAMAESGQLGIAKTIEDQLRVQDLQRDLARQALGDAGNDGARAVQESVPAADSRERRS